MTDEQFDGILEEIGDLATTVSDAIAKLGEGDRYDKELSKTIQSYFEKTSQFISKFKAIDLTPVINIANDISKQNVSILAFLEVLKKSDTNVQITNLLTESIKRSNEFVERGLKQTDYTNQFIEIKEVLSDKIVKLRVTERDQAGRLLELTPTYKNTNG